MYFLLYKNKEMVMQSNIDIIGIYRLIIKSELDNYISTAIQVIIRRLKEKDVEVVIYEPTSYDDTFAYCIVIKDFKKLFNELNVIANRFKATLEPIKNKICT